MQAKVTAFIGTAGELRIRKAGRVGRDAGDSVVVQHIVRGCRKPACMAWFTHQWRTYRGMQRGEEAAGGGRFERKVRR